MGKTENNIHAFVKEFPMGKMISLDAAADEIGASKRTVRRLISSGELRAYRIGKAVIRVDHDDLEKAFKPIVASELRP
jgi:excisionase family DNA binding protein